MLSRRTASSAACSRGAAWLAAMAVATSGCLAGSTSLTATATLTMITADPTAFIGSATCGTRLKTYVVTITDVTHGLPIASYSSGPTACTNLVSFAGPTPGTSNIGVLIVGDSYIAAIDGYDRDDIKPKVDGFPDMIAANDPMLPVVPRWTTTCGRAPGTAEAGADAADESGAAANPLFAPVQAKASTEVFLLGCIPFSDSVSEPDGGADATDDASQDGG
jgi:hypothetical protein